MHMSYCTRCACRTALDVHVKQLCIPSADIFLPDLINEYRRVMVKSTIDCFLLPSSFSLLPFSVTIVSFHCHYCLTLIYDMFLIVSEIIVILCFC